MTVDLNATWFILVGVLFAGYAVLDGFDLGVGALHLLTKSDHDRRVMLNSIGPVWDGNEVWLVTGGGALFAAFPEVYATAFSGFYEALVLLLVSLIFRAVSIELRSKQPMRWWRRMWDVCFASGSVVAALLIGVALGNVAWGVPLDARHEFAGSFWGLLHPYALMVGVTTVALFSMHGCIYVVMKTEGDLQELARRWVRPTIVFFILSYVLTSMATLVYLPHMVDELRSQPAFFVLPLLNVLAVANIPREIHHGREFRAFLSSCASMMLLLTIFGVGMFPYLIFSKPAPENSLTIHNAASSQKTLGIMLTVAMLGMPLVVAYTSIIYWVFRGKVRLDSASY
ncbi:MAG: cytochrome d ubiquinol oxidase subunit II [Polyangiaceae bacterium]|nr:cytochrome d ubiquinol oxidase subunit II [Polyangiaceae bacterium]